jgi:hypothetical protein
MIMGIKISNLTFVILLFTFELFLESGCKSGNFNNLSPAGREPVISPDYSGVTIPPNIAPLNFLISEKGSSYRIIVTAQNGMEQSFASSDGAVMFPVKSWKELITNSIGGKLKIEILADEDGNTGKQYSPFYINVAREPVDPYLCYRLLYPGYRSWVEMKIVERSLEDFSEESLFENQLLEDNCVNCHSFRQNSPDKFLLHVRGSKGGTYFINGGTITRTALKTKEMPANAVYPAWHPSGRYVAFSSNKTVQTFHMRPEKNIEVFDLYSSLVVFDTGKNEMFACSDNDSTQFMETFPCWSSDGNSLYYCRAPQTKEGSDYSQVKYDLVRKSFDKITGVFGNSEVVFNASALNKSVSFPVVSPDGKYLVFTLHDYGTFSIWHKEADLYLLDLQAGKSIRMELNSDETESYHSWSSNGRWLVFSSKRGDGLTARPYFAYFSSPDSTGKPFVLPQKDPSLYTRLEKTFNRPEFVTGKITVGPRDFVRASGKVPVKTMWVEKDTLPDSTNSSRK